MASAKVAITIPAAVLKRVDSLVKRRIFPNRSKAIQYALSETLGRLDRGRLARECGKLDPREEQAMSEEGLAREVEQWPDY
jgi:Arc/MetJ-type ribon-helix-helix transcriptional regulator